jgi:hypothetical protein
MGVKYLLTTDHHNVDGEPYEIDHKGRFIPPQQKTSSSVE